MESVAKVYARHAIGFDRVRTRELMEEPYLEIVAGLLPPPARVLDLGCGGGEPIARYFIERGYDLTGIDIAEEMLVMCRSRFPSVTWLKEDMRSMALSTRFDLLIAWDSFFHLRRDEQRQMFETFRHHTAPRGVLLFTSGTEDGESIGDLFGDPLYHSSLDTSEYQAQLNDKGFEVVLHQVQDENCGGHTVWVARQH